MICMSLAGEQLRGELTLTGEWVWVVCLWKGFDRCWCLQGSWSTPQGCSCYLPFQRQRWGAGAFHGTQALPGTYIQRSQVCAVAVLWLQLPATVHPGRQQWWSAWLSPCCPDGRRRRGPILLAGPGPAWLLQAFGEWSSQWMVFVWSVFCLSQVKKWKQNIRKEVDSIHLVCCRVLYLRLCGFNLVSFPTTTHYPPTSGRFPCLSSWELLL